MSHRTKNKKNREAIILAARVKPTAKLDLSKSCDKNQSKDENREDRSTDLKSSEADKVD